MLYRFFLLGAFVPDQLSTILVCGGTGSLGHALTRFLLDTTTATIRILSRDEFKQSEMRKVFGDERVRYFLGDVRDLARLNLACYQTDLVIHAAALKQIDKGEVDPTEFIATNVQGTLNMISACRTMNVKRAVFIGTDKCISPINTYGLTKSLAERVWIRANGYSPHGTIYTAVRYANVAGSRGSVIPLWQEQLAHGIQPGITDLDMTRFHLTLGEAVQLIWFAAHHAPRGAIVVPHVPAYQITDLYEAVCGAVPYRVIGVRPGEKLHEELMMPDELRRAWVCTDWDTPDTPRYYLIPPVAPTWGFPTMPTLAFPAPLLVHPPGLLPLASVYRSDVWPWRLSSTDFHHQRGILHAAD